MAQLPGAPPKGTPPWALPGGLSDWQKKIAKAEMEDRIAQEQRRIQQQWQGDEWFRLQEYAQKPIPPAPKVIAPGAEKLMQLMAEAAVVAQDSDEYVISLHIEPMGVSVSGYVAKDYATQLVAWYAINEHLCQRMPSNPLLKAIEIVQDRLRYMALNGQVQEAQN